jgi:hypothetical protein
MKKQNTKNIAKKLFKAVRKTSLAVGGLLSIVSPVAIYAEYGGQSLGNQEENCAGCGSEGYGGQREDKKIKIDFTREYKDNKIYAVAGWDNKNDTVYVDLGCDRSLDYVIINNSNPQESIFIQQGDKNWEKYVAIFNKAITGKDCLFE